MSKIWNFKGYVIDEGLKPHDANYKSDYYQYFFIVKRDSKHIFKYCIWLKKSIIEADEGMKQEMRTTGHKINQRLYELATARVKEKIVNREFTNKLLIVDDEDGETEVNLDEMKKKIR
ncbi:MAG TPA: hypothetical protein ENH19_00725 [Actinobacteria bacterium]|nr:hypothetical protein [Actinomycetes bacterium]HEX21160.1 hypothetical protein [Actinomycetota bacterium]